MTATYLEFSLELKPRDPWSDILISQMTECGFESFMENEKGFCAYIQSLNCEEMKIRELIGSFEKKVRILYAIKEIQPTNWNEEWEKNFERIQVDSRCCIRASFHQPEKGMEFDIVIDPKMAFGTGHHDTTFLMTQKLLVTNVYGKASLDMGCGTGILAILLSMKGANPVWAVDTDEQACLNASENIRANKITNIIVNKGGAEILAGRIFDVILANINRNVLLEDMEKYVQSLTEKGVLIMSGFFKEDVPLLLEKASQLGLLCTEQVSRNNWALIELKK